MNGILPSITILGSLALVALAASVRRSGFSADALPIQRAARAAAVTVAAQSIHFTEELATGFHVRFPELFGLGPMPLSFFVAFNVAWIGIWALSAHGLTSRNRLGLFPLWFLALAGIANGFAHPAFALITGGYFPGLVTSPVVAVLAFLLLRRLVEATVQLTPRRER